WGVCVWWGVWRVISCWRCRLPGHFSPKRTPIDALLLCIDKHKLRVRIRITHGVHAYPVGGKKDVVCTGMERRLPAPAQQLKPGFMYPDECELMSLSPCPVEEGVHQAGEIAEVLCCCHVGSLV